MDLEHLFWDSVELPSLNSCSNASISLLEISLEVSSVPVSSIDQACMGASQAFTFPFIQRQTQALTFLYKWYRRGPSILIIFGLQFPERSMHV
jgi:hypothetical protein